MTTIDIQRAACRRIAANFPALLFALLHPVSLVLAALFVARLTYERAGLSDANASLLAAALLALLLVFAIGSLSALTAALCGDRFETISRTAVVSCAGFAQTLSARVALAAPAFITMALPQVAWFYLAPAVKVIYRVNAIEALTVSYALAEGRFWQILAWALPSIGMTALTVAALVAALAAGSTSLPALVAAVGLLLCLVYAAAVQTEIVERLEDELNEELLDRAAARRWRWGVTLAGQAAFASVLILRGHEIVSAVARLISGLSH